jgi:hypothetical protein
MLRYAPPPGTVEYRYLPEQIAIPLIVLAGTTIMAPYVPEMPPVTPGSQPMVKRITFLFLV